MSKGEPVSTTQLYSFDERHGLRAARCKHCGKVSCPPRPYHCDESTLPTTIEPKGTVQSWTTIRVAPSAYSPPYVLLLVHLNAGPRVVARLEDSVDDSESLRERAVKLLPAATDAGYGTHLTAVLESSGL